MTDLHSHIVYDVDDGSSSTQESIELLRGLKSVGFDNVIMTPHYIEGSEYCSENEEKLEKLDILRNEVRRNNIDINLYLGNEVFINDYMVEGIENGRIYTLNNSKYLLFELPFHNRIISLSDIIYEIKIQGYIPILAHPERYIYSQDNYDLVDELIRQLRQHIQKYPGFADGYYKLGQALEAKGLRNEAMMAFRKALEINPSYEIARKSFWKR